MIQDILPYRLDNHYDPERRPSAASHMVYIKNSAVLCRKDGDNISLPSAKAGEEGVYLFSVDDEDFFLAEEGAQEPEGYVYCTLTELRTCRPKQLRFAALTAYHLAVWYRANRFCGACGTRTERSEEERMLRCPSCGNTIYPRISPAVIVGVISKDRLLLTRYVGRPKGRNALVAGFTEIGETVEETVQREVMEETGLKVKNITYYKSQPWPFSGTLLLGFFCELDGSDDILVDESELAEAHFVTREEIPENNDDVSLTAEMIRLFRNGGWK